jgi:hypothetical protein
MNQVAPARRLAVFRILTGLYALGYVVGRIPYYLDLAELPDRRWTPPLPLSWLGSPPGRSTVIVVLGATLLTGIGYVLGWSHRWVGPAFAVLLLGVLSYGNAWGHVFHTDNLLALHVGIVALARSADAWAVGAPAVEPADDVRYGFPLRLAAVVTVLTYVVTGIAKLRYAGMDWLAGDTLLNQIAFDNARKKVLGDDYSPLAAAFAAHPWLFRPMGLLTVVVELGAPVALISRRWAAAWTAAAWTFHLGILALMWITFAYPLTLVAFAPFFRLERPVDRVLEARAVPRLAP